MSTADRLPTIDEVLRRQAARAAGLPLSASWAEIHGAPGAEAGTPAPEDARALEKETQAAIVKLWRALGCTVYSLSQPRHAKYLTPGLPDLWVFSPRLARAWWWETKRPAGGRLSPAQVEFAEFCAACAVDHGHGARADAEAFAIAIGLAYRTPAGTLEPTRPPAPA